MGISRNRALTFNHKFLPSDEVSPQMAVSAPISVFQVTLIHSVNTVYNRYCQQSHPANTQGSG